MIGTVRRIWIRGEEIRGSQELAPPDVLKVLDEKVQTGCEKL